MSEYMVTPYRKPGPEALQRKETMRAISHLDLPGADTRLFAMALLDELYRDHLPPVEGIVVFSDSSRENMPFINYVGEVAQSLGTEFTPAQIGAITMYYALELTQRQQEWDNMEDLGLVYG